MVYVSSYFSSPPRPPLEQAKKNLEDFYNQVFVPHPEIEINIQEYWLNPTKKPSPEFLREIRDMEYNRNIQIVVDPQNSQGFAAASPSAPLENPKGFDTFFKKEVPTIFLHPLLLLNPDELPLELLTNNPLTERSLYLEKLAAWLKDKFELKKPFKISKNLLDAFLEIWKKPEHLDQVRHFVLAHEFGHHHYKHFKRPWHLFLSFFLTCAIVALFASSLSVEGIFLLTYLSLKVTTLVATCLFLYYYRKNEVEADLLAYQLTKETTGAKVFFEAIDKMKTAIWNKLPTWKKIYTAVVHPEEVFPLSHPSPKTRIAYLEAAAKKA